MNYRHPTLDDGSKIYSLVKSCPPLDVNSQYFYYILCKDFGNTCVVAEYDRNLLGFVSAYLQPEKSQSLFVWQVAVFKNERRKRVALNMLDWLIKQPKCINIQFMATPFLHWISPPKSCLFVSQKIIMQISKRDCSLINPILIMNLMRRKYYVQFPHSIKK